MPVLFRPNMETKNYKLLFLFWNTIFQSNSLTWKIYSINPDSELSLLCSGSSQSCLDCNPAPIAPAQKVFLLGACCLWASKRISTTEKRSRAAWSNELEIQKHPLGFHNHEILIKKGNLTICWLQQENKFVETDLMSYSYRQLVLHFTV